MTDKRTPVEETEGWEPHGKFEQTGIKVGIVEQEWLCPHGVGHEKGTHGCDGCCANVILPEKPPTKRVII